MAGLDFPSPFYRDDNPAAPPRASAPRLLRTVENSDQFIDDRLDGQPQSQGVVVADSLFAISNTWCWRFNAY